MKKSFYISLVLALFSGILIAWNDSRPNWDDTAISVFLVFSSSALFGFLAGKKPWLIALAVGSWVPVFSLFQHFDFKLLLVLIPAFAGAYINFLVKKIIIV